MATSNSIFSNYHPNGHHINPSLLWEYDMSTFDWQRSKTIVVQRVVELGWPEIPATPASIAGSIVFKKSFCRMHRTNSQPKISKIKRHIVFVPFIEKEPRASGVVRILRIQRT